MDKKRRSSTSLELNLRNCGCLFISSVFPVAAGPSKNTAAFPKWWGILDVSIALVLVLVPFVIMALTHGKADKQVEDTTYRVYRVLLHGILAMTGVFFLFGSHIAWINCVTGFAWLPLYCTACLLGLQL